MEQEYYKRMAEEMSKEIDKTILKTLLSESEDKIRIDKLENILKEISKNEEN